MVQHNAKQFLLCWAARTKQEFHEGMVKDVFPHGVNIVGLCATTSVDQLAYEEKVLRHITEKPGGSFLSEEDEPYRLWLRNVSASSLDHLGECYRKKVRGYRRPPGYCL